jgi:enolase-phosphatase E1
VFRAQLFSGPREFELNLPFLPKNSSTLWLLLDIEGTTSSVEFVYKTLFPYASVRVESYLREHFGEAEIQTLIGALRAEHEVEAATNAELDEWLRATSEEEITSAARYVHRLIALDRKATSLKTLQGKIWEEGFRSGELLGDVYEDVPRAFARWSAEGKRIAIFSSGSVQAQRLLFGHSKAGDLTKYIEAYFDTTTGPKREAASYRAIGKALGVRTESVLFVSDVAAELDAAAGAGMATALMARPGAVSSNDRRHSCIESFDELNGKQERKHL